jgi:hypothetical protein
MECNGPLRTRFCGEQSGCLDFLSLEEIEAEVQANRSEIDGAFSLLTAFLAQALSRADPLPDAC